jgi:trk system potassium uptake protein
LNKTATLRILGVLLIVLSSLLLVPCLVAVVYDEPWIPFLESALITFAMGFLITKIFNKEKGQIGHREAFAIVTFCWLFFSFSGALPYYTTGVLPSLVDSFFESMSGFTTTGSTVIRDLNGIPKSILFWRSFTQWLGGMGIIVLSVAILPMLGVGGLQLFHAEVPGLNKDRIQPRIESTAKLLWGIYFGLTVLLMAILYLEGMNLFESICHGFTTMATGGFSTRNGSIAEFNFPLIQWTLIAFMFLASINFSLHFRVFQEGPQVFKKNEEFLIYILILFISFLIISIFTFNPDVSFEENIRHAAFQVVAIGSNTGYVNTNYEMWPLAAQAILLSLMIVGGCSGSTSGGTKVIRLLVVFKYIIQQIHILLHPKAIRTIKIDNFPVGPSVIQNVMGLFTIFAFTFGVGSLILAATGLDHITALASVLACITNIGPGFGSVGPTENFADINDVGKITLSIIMLVGRLEFFTVYVMLLPTFWRR